MNQKRLLRRIFPVIAFLLLAPWPVAYGYEATGDAAQQPVRITAAETSAQPAWTAFGKAIGGVTAGDLFYIDAADSPADIGVTLYLTNTRELASGYRYLILKVGLHRQGADGEWHRVTEYAGEPVPDIFITMLNGQVSFNLPGSGSYKVTIDEGSFYSYGAGATSLSPVFYLEVN